MVTKTQTIKAAIILVMVAVFPFVSMSQTKNVSKWIVGNYLFDFTTSPMTISKLEEPFCGLYGNRKNLYIDADGKVRLVQIAHALYDGDGNEIKYEDGEPKAHFSYLIPMPNNDDIICGIGDGFLYKIDIEKKEIISVEQNNTYYNLPIIVHNADCSGVWLIQSDGKSIIRHLLTSDGIKEFPPISNVGYPDNILCNLSWDCKYYTWCNSDEYVYFGRFDRRSASFQQIAMHNFGKATIYKGVFAPDNSKVYYSIRQNGEKIIEVPIVDGIPDFNNMRTICQFNYSPPHLISEIRFGLDGRLYIYDKGIVHVVEFFDDGQFKVTKNFLTMDGKFFMRVFPSYLSDWYSDDPCSGTQCPDMPAPVIIKD